VNHVRKLAVRDLTCPSRPYEQIVTCLRSGISGSYEREIVGEQIGELNDVVPSCDFRNAYNYRLCTQIESEVRVRRAMSIG
jgi:hypothetical protein